MAFQKNPKFDPQAWYWLLGLKKSQTAKNPAERIK